MDCVYSSWVTAHADGFTDAHVAALTRVVPTLALAVKAAALARMTGTLMETYLGRDAGRRVLSGRIMRGFADRIDAVIWFSDLRGFTRITDSAPEQVIPLLNDYADVIVSAIHAQGGDVLKLIGDGILAIFAAADRANACAAALTAATATRSEVVALNIRRARDGLPVTDMSACMSARCSMAISAAPSGSISPWSGRQSTRPAGSPPCAGRSINRCWSLRRSPMLTACAAGLYRSAGTRYAGSRSRKSFSRWIPPKAVRHALSATGTERTFKIERDSALGH